MQLGDSIQKTISAYADDNVDAHVVVSHRYQFIYVRIAKNASTSLTSEFSKERYQSEKMRYSKVDPEHKQRYFTFAFVRDPVERFLSGYHELVTRKSTPPAKRWANLGRDVGSDIGEVSKDYLSIEDPIKRLKAFLSLIELGKWDNHIKDQLAFLRHIEFNYLATIQSSESDLDNIYTHLAMGDRPKIERKNTRIQRLRRAEWAKRSGEAQQSEDKFQVGHLFFRKDLDAETLQSIQKAYAKDLHLYEAALNAQSLLND